MNAKFVAFALAAAAAAPAFAAEPQNAAYTIDLVGHVPVICRATLDQPVVAARPGEIALGELNEFCNNPRGYQVLVDASAELAGAVLIVDGIATPLSGEGPTLLSSSEGPAMTARDVRISLPEGSEAGNLSFRIVAL